MFIIEKLVGDHQRSVEAWEHARDKWVNNGGEYSYRSNRDYERQHPRPGTTALMVAKVAVVVVGIALVTLLIIGFAFNVRDENKKHPKPVTQAVTYKNGQECGKFHVGDIATIDFGDYEGAEVKIVGGCGDNEDYEVITTKDQTLFGEGSEHSDLTDKHISAGLTFKVNSSSNLIVTGHSKE